ncbi:DegT/DnrJ/EryC1/StrS family aminotransferase [Patescibacteria group bacterium]|nr:DegT/DnrJ/EryC1/StrS family aminotransferase [Patescibacteria group bacterium]
MKISLARPDITELERRYVLEVLNTSNLSLGPKLQEFEKKIAKYVGCRYAIAVNSGTSGLHLIIRAMGIGEGDEVITTSFSFIASANCILFERAKPVFIDIDAETLNIDVRKIVEKLRGLKRIEDLKKIKAILAVDIFGQPAEWDELKEIAKNYNLKLIEDCAEALGAEYKGKKAGSLGDAGVFGFYPNKQITTGEGGTIVTNDEKIARLCRSMRNQGRDEGSDWLEHKRLGYNYRLSDINCALGLAQLERINEILEKRDKVARMYNERLADMNEVETPYVSQEINPSPSPNLSPQGRGNEEMIIPSPPRGEGIGRKVKISWFVYVVRLRGDYTRAERDKILKGLRERGVECRAYFSPIHLQPFYRKMFGYKKGDFPITESISERTIALPFYNNLKEEEINYVVENLKKIIRRW